jgi:hypothetical protein
MPKHTVSETDLMNWILLHTLPPIKAKIPSAKQIMQNADWCAWLRETFPTLQDQELEEWIQLDIVQPFEEMQAARNQSCLYVMAKRTNHLVIVLTVLVGGVAAMNLWARTLEDVTILHMTTMLLQKVCFVYTLLVMWLMTRNVSVTAVTNFIRKKVLCPAFVTLGMGALDTNSALLIDSGCSKTIIRNRKKLRNISTPDVNYVVYGVGGRLPIHEVGDLPIALKHPNGKVQVCVIKECLLNPDATASLLPVTDLQQAGLGLHVPSDTGLPAHLFVTDEDGEALTFPLKQHDGLWMLPFYEDHMTQFAGA